MKTFLNFLFLLPIALLSIMFLFIVTIYFIPYFLINKKESLTYAKTIRKTLLNE